MNRPSSIVPPPELIEGLRLSSGTWLDKITVAYQAGADMELEACCGLLEPYSATEIHTVRRPKPPSLKEQALALLSKHNDGWAPSPKDWDTIRRALEAQ
jgi:hypothetical protein